MPEGSVPLLVALIFLVLFSAFFSSTETAFSCVNRIKLRSMQQNGNKRAGKVLDLTENNYDKSRNNVYNKRVLSQNLPKGARKRTKKHKYNRKSENESNGVF